MLETATVLVSKWYMQWMKGKQAGRLCWGVVLVKTANAIDE